jgi:hypothetical protein
MVDLATLESEEAQADTDNGLPAGFLERQGTIESGQGSNTGSNGTIFQVSPATAIDPGYGLQSVDGNDPESVGAYDQALYQQTGSYSGAALAYNEGIGTYQQDGGSSATPAYQAFAAAIGGQGNEGDGGSSSGGSSSGGSSSSGMSVGGMLANPMGALTGGLLGDGTTSLTGSGGAIGSSGSGGGVEEELGTFISTWVIRILIAIGGLICVAVALSMFKTTAPIVTSVTSAAKKTAVGAAAVA